MGISSDKFSEIVFKSSPESLYYQHKIPKRGRSPKNSFRIVWESRDPGLSDLHKVLYLRLASFAAASCGYPHHCVHGYVRGRSTKTNAQVHAGNKELLRCDIADFFPSITKDRVNALFLHLGFKEIPSELLSRFTTINGALPLGLQASPLIANLICSALDDELQALAGQHGLSYTRYADDISLSGEKIALSFADVNDIVMRHGFTLSCHKFRITKRGQAHFVTGLSISDIIPRIPRQIKRSLRQELYYANKYGIKEHLRKRSSTSYQSDINHISGLLSYIHSVEPELAARLKGQWLGILDRDKLSQAYLPRFDRQPRSLTYLIDETIVDISSNNAILALCCVVVEDEIEFRDLANHLVNRYLLDPFSSADKSVLEAKGAHFTELSEPFRTDYLRDIASRPFRAYVIYDILNHAHYDDQYVELLSRLLTHRYISSDRAKVVVVCEENPQVSPAKIEELVRTRYAALEKKGSRRPIDIPKTVIGSKLDHPELSLSDAILWVFRSFGQVEAPTGSRGHRRPGETSERRFESIRDKIRLIMSLPTAENFTLNKPFYPWQDGNPLIRRSSAYHPLAR